MPARAAPVSRCVPVRARHRSRWSSSAWRHSMLTPSPTATSGTARPGPMPRPMAFRSSSPPMVSEPSVSSIVMSRSRLRGSAGSYGFWGANTQNRPYVTMPAPPAAASTTKASRT